MMSDWESKITDFRIFKDNLKGQSALVMGNGWSVNFFPKSIYSKFYTLGVNMIFLYHTPNVWVCPDYGNDFNSHLDWSNDAKIRVCSTRNKGRQLATHIVQCSQQERMKEVNAPGELFSAGSSVFMAIGLAAIMGADPILTIGCDGDCDPYPYYFYSEYDPYPLPKEHYIPSKEKKERVSNIVSESWRRTLSIAEKEKINILNCSPISKFDMVPKANLLDFV